MRGKKIKSPFRFKGWCGRAGSGGIEGAKEKKGVQKARWHWGCPSFVSVTVPGGIWWRTKPSAEQGPWLLAPKIWAPAGPEGVWKQGPHRQPHAASLGGGLLPSCPEPFPPSPPRSAFPHPPAAHLLSRAGNIHAHLCSFNIHLF